MGERADGFLKGAEARATPWYRFYGWQGFRGASALPSQDLSLARPALRVLQETEYFSLQRNLF
jgi:hypothetical protein